MSSLRHLPATLLLLAAAICAPTAAHAAESYDNCTGFINSLPTTITTQGVWCLNQNLSTAITTGNAITIAANNVTIDCNDFKIGGLAAGDSSQTKGIYAGNRQNATVRNCAIRGFHHGIYLAGAGHLVEDNRLDNSLKYGISIWGDNNLVRRNRVYDTGGYTGGNGSYVYAYGISASANVIDNIVSGMFATGTNTMLRGITIHGAGNQVRGNQVRGLVVSGAGNAMGIVAGSPRITVADNRLSAATATYGFGVDGVGADTFCTGNIAVNFNTASYSGCDHSFGNLPATP